MAVEFHSFPAGGLRARFALSEAEGGHGDVSVVGPFNDWTPGAHVLRADPSGRWAVTAELDEPGPVRFRYLGPDGRWFDDPAADLVDDQGSVAVPPPLSALPALPELPELPELSELPESPVERRFEFAFEGRYRAAARIFGVRPGTTAITVGPEELSIRFGPWSVRTPLSNITSATATGPYAFLKTAGPARLGITDRGLTFATNSRAGVCLEFHTPVVGIDRFGLIKHPNLTVTPVEVDGLVATLTR